MDALPSAAGSNDEALPVHGVDAFTAVTTEEKLLHSYDRFYKVVSKTTTKDTDSTAPPPSLEQFLHDSPSLSEKSQATLREVWRRAQRFTEVQRVVENFHQYRSDLVRKALRDSKALQSQSAEVELEDGLKEVLRSQCRMEQQMQFHSALLVGIEQHRDHFPAVVMQLIEKSSEAKHNEEKRALHNLLNQSQKQIDRLEQMTASLDTKFLKWSAARDSEWKLSSNAWPETLHNNIVYSSASCFEGSNASSSGVPSSEEMPSIALKDIDVTDGGEDGAAVVDECLMTEQSPEGNVNQGESKEQELMEAPPKLMCHLDDVMGDDRVNDRMIRSEASISAIMADCDASGDDGDVTLSRNLNKDQQQQHLQKAALSSTQHQANKSVESHLVQGNEKSDSETAEARHEADAHIRIADQARRLHLSEDFKEHFLQDVLRVQQNIQSSNLGSPTATLHSISSSSSDMAPSKPKDRQQFRAVEAGDGGRTAGVGTGMLDADVVSLLSASSSFSADMHEENTRNLGIQ